MACALMFYTGHVNGPDGSVEKIMALHLSSSFFRIRWDYITKLITAIGYITRLVLSIVGDKTWRPSDEPLNLVYRCFILGTLKNQMALSE